MAATSSDVVKEVLEAGWCQVNTPIEGSKYVCLGPGKVCPGGTYLGGNGAYPDCEYPPNPSGFVLFVILVILTVFFTVLKDRMAEWVPKTYTAVMHAIIAELATLGFVSLIAFVIKYQWEHESWIDIIGADLSLGKELKNDFNILHFLLFGLSISFLSFCTFFLSSALRRLKKFDEYQGLINEMVEEHKGLPTLGTHVPQINWMARLTEDDRREIYFRIHDRFTDSENVVQGDLHMHIPRNFNLAKYLMMASSKIMAEVVEIHPLDWVLVLVLAAISWVAWFLTSAQSDDPAATDGGYVVFWVYESLFVFIGLVLDRKVHNIYVQLIPAVENDVSAYHQDYSRQGERSSSSQQLLTRGGAEDWEEARRRSGAAEEEAERRRQGFLQATEHKRPSADRPRPAPSPPAPASEDRRRERARGGGEAEAGGGERSGGCSDLADLQLPPAAALRDAGQRMECVILEERARSPEAEAAAAAGVGPALPRSLSPAGSAASTLSQPAPVLIRQAPPLIAASPGNSKQEPCQDVRSPTEEEEEEARDDAGAAVLVAGQAFGSAPPLPRSGSPPLLPRHNSLSRNGSLGRAGSLGGVSEVEEEQGEGEGQGQGQGRGFGASMRGLQNDVKVDVNLTPELEQHRRRRFVPPYIKLSNERLFGRSWWSKKLGGHVINHHQYLFWFQEHGPHVLLHFIRHQVLGSCVLVVIALVMYRDKMLCTGDWPACTKTTPEGIVVLGISLFLPILGAAFLSNTLSNYTVACNIEYMKSASLIKEVMAKARAKKTLKLFGALLTLASLIDGLKSLAEELGSMSATASVCMADGTSDPDRQGPPSATGRGSFDNRRNTSLEHGSRTPQGSFMKAPAAVRKSLDLVRPNFLRGKGEESRGSGRSLEYDRFASSELVGRSTANVTTGRVSLDAKRRNNGVYGKAGRWEVEKSGGGKVHVKMLATEVIQQWEDLFHEADLDQTNTLSLDEFKALVRATGTLGSGPEADAHVTHLFQMMDSDGNGRISFEEFISVMAQEKTRKLDPDSLADTIWSLFDPRRSGCIQIHEMEATLKRMRPNYDTAGAVQFMNEIDLDRRGWVTRGEFILFVTRIMHTIQ